MARDRLVKAAVFRLVLQGVNPASRQEVVGGTVRKQVHYSGGSSGIGFRVARGVYVRTGGFRGRR